MEPNVTSGPRRAGRRLVTGSPAPLLKPERLPKLVRLISRTG